MYGTRRHELMRALEAQSILDCADMAAAASLYRTESRWGLYHNRVDYPGQGRRELVLPLDPDQGRDGVPTLTKKRGRALRRRIEEHERDAYDKQRIQAAE